jgi:hypothetical protein
MASPSTGDRDAATSPGQRLAQGLLIALMAIGSVLLWVGVPVGWLWIGSQVQAKTQGDGFGPYMIVIAGIAVSIFLLAIALARLNRAYGRIASGGEEEVVRVRMPWHRSMRGEDDSRPPRSVLDVVMVCSVSVALLVFAVWFFFLAGSPLPST